ncbi:MAG: 2-dehydropantoate 2-reductase N-terminal domain-containing protein [Vibrio fluvialis]
MRVSRVSVVGLGRLGLVHAAALASVGHTVTGIDSNAQRIRAIRDGALDTHEPNLAQLVHTTLHDGTLDVSDDPADLHGARVHFLAVGTPERGPDEGFDTGHLENALRSSRAAPWERRS